MLKSELRKKYTTLRESLSLDEVEQQSLDIANQLLKLDIWNHSYYHIFLPIEAKVEVNTEFILHTLQGKDKHVVISKSNFDNNILTHFLLTDQTTLKINKWGIPEPEGGIEIASKSIEVVFVPLLAYDKKGYRVGYGKGFYDRFLKEAQPKVTIGLSFFEPELNDICNINKYDVSLDYCITPKKAYQFALNDPQ